MSSRVLVIIFTCLSLLCLSHTGLAGAPARPPVYPVSWQQANWFLDPANSSGLASDKNDCKTTSTPCVHWYEINARWGCGNNPQGCPILQQDTNITFMSSQPAYNDPVIFRPSLGVIGASTPTNFFGPTVNFTGTLTTVSTGNAFTLTSAKNIATNTPLVGTIATSPPVDVLLQNTTHASVAWNPVIAATGQISQPMTAYVASGGSGATTGPSIEIDTWATSDLISVFSLPNVWLVDVSPISTAIQGRSTVQILHIEVPEHYSGVRAGDDRVTIGDFVQVNESIFQKQIQMNVIAQPFTMAGKPTFSNCALDGGFAGGATASVQYVTAAQGKQGIPLLSAGYVQAQSTSGIGTALVSFRGVWLDSDIIIKQGNGALSVTFGGLNFLGTVHFESAATLLYGVLDAATLHLTSNAVWGGPGISTTLLDVGRGQLLYTAGAAAAASEFTINGGLKIQNGTLACLGTSVAIGACNKTISPANLDTDLGATTGCYFVPGSGSICNSSY